MKEFSIFKGYYIIDTNVRFTPVTRELVKEGGAEKIILQTPASQCLTLLLKKQGQVIHRDELLAFAWGSEAAKFISNNNYYQTISYLRKTLMSLGYDNLIQTVPKKGLMIGSNVQVDFSPHQANESSIVNEKNEDTSLDINCNRWGTRQLYIFIILIMLSLISTYIFFVLMRDKHNLFSEYKKITSDNCIVLYNNEAALNLFKLKEQNAQFDCQRNSTIIVTNNPRTHGSSLIYCELGKGNNKICQSETFVGI